MAPPVLRLRRAGEAALSELTEQERSDLAVFVLSL